MNLVLGSAENLDCVLVEKERKEFHVLSIKPHGDAYRLSNCYVNINSKDIDKDEVAMYAGMAEDFVAEEFAAACVEYYGERFWGGGSYTLTKEEAQEKIKKYLTVEPVPAETVNDAVEEIKEEEKEEDAA